MDESEVGLLDERVCEMQEYCMLFLCNVIEKTDKITLEPLIIYCNSLCISIVYIIAIVHI